MYKKYIMSLITLLEDTKYTLVNQEELVGEEFFKMLVDIFLAERKEKGKVFFIGNGGSAAIASHMTADFMKNGKMRTCSLYDSATLSCFANDCGYEEVFAKQIDMLGGARDLLVAISSSGNSPNIVKAINIAKGKKIKVITFTGFKENNAARQLGDYNIYVPVEHYGIVESIHNLLLQQIVDTILAKDNNGEVV